MTQDLGEIREALKKDPNNPFALRSAARHYLRQGSHRSAKNHYVQAVRLWPYLLANVILDYEDEISRDPAKIGPRLSLAGFQMVLGEVDAAVLEIEEALEVNPRSIEAYNVLGKIYLKQERVDDAIALLERSIQEGIKDVALIEILAGAYLEKGRIKEAIAFYEEILDYRPGDKQILRVVGELYTRLEDYQKAAESYRAMFSDDPEVSREVIQRLEELLKKVEGSIFIREILSDIYMKSLKPEAAVAKIQEIIRLDSAKMEEATERLKAILKNYPAHPQAAAALGEILRLQGNFSEAAEVYHGLVGGQPQLLANPTIVGKAISGYQEILELCPEQILARSYLAEAYLYSGEIKQALQEFEQMVEVDPGTAEGVIRRCRDILKKQPHLLLAHLVLGRAHLAKGEVQRAVSEAEEILAIDKRFTPAYLLLGEAYSKLKLGRRAAENLRFALGIDPYNELVQKKYREIREKELDLEINTIKEGISADPWKISLHLDLAKLYLQKEDEEAAIRELQLVLKDQTRAPFAANLLGCIYRGQGRFDLALAQFNRALELAPPEIAEFARSVRFNLGSAYEAQGAVRKASKIYESILQEDIDFGNLKRRVKYLKATNLNSMHHRSLLAVISRYKRSDIIALWGREGRSADRGRREEVSLSFGQKHNTSGFEFFMRGMYKAAAEEFQLAVQLDQGFAAALNNWGVALAKEGRLSEAKMKLEEAVDINPHSAIFRNNLGVVYLLAGNIDASHRELEKAKETDAELSAAALNLGDVCYIQGEIEEAMKLYQRAGKFDVLAEIADSRLMYKVAG